MVVILDTIGGEDRTQFVQIERVPYPDTSIGEPDELLRIDFLGDDSEVFESALIDGEELRKALYALLN